MAVKWCDTIASVSNTAAIAASRLLNERTATSMANAPKIIPKMIEAATKSDPPHNAAGNFDRKHSGVVHRRNAAADQCTGQWRRPTRLHVDRNAQRKAHGGGRRGERENGQGHAVGNRDPGLIGQHRHEMRGPDAKAAGYASGNNPNDARSTTGRARAVEDVDRAEAREQTNDSGNSDESPVMLER